MRDQEGHKEGFLFGHRPGAEIGSGIKHQAQLRPLVKKSPYLAMMPGDGEKIGDALRFLDMPRFKGGEKEARDDGERA